jgi:hypothetical protein
MDLGGSAETVVVGHTEGGVTQLCGDGDEFGRV